MKKALKTGLTLTGLALVAGGLAYGGAELVHMDRALDGNPAYAVHRRYNMIDSGLKLAQDLLEYTPPDTIKLENFPRPGIARLNLEGALMWYKTVPDRGKQDFTLMTDIMDIRESLPGDVEIKIYEGERVDNDTFAEQRLAIEEVRSDVQEIADDQLQSALLEKGVDQDYDDVWLGSHVKTGIYVAGAGCLILLVVMGSRGEKKKDE